MKLNTGLNEIKIEFTNGESGTIYYNPTDPKLYNRLKAFDEIISKRIEEVEGENIDAINIADNIVREELDNTFNSDVSSVLFKYTSPLAVMPDGTVYFAYVAGELAKEVKDGSERAYKEFVEKNKAAAEKHLKKYDV